jgi:hypothetical protein
VNIATRMVDSGSQSVTPNVFGPYTSPLTSVTADKSCQGDSTGWGDQVEIRSNWNPLKAEPPVGPCLKTV